VARSIIGTAGNRKRGVLTWLPSPISLDSMMREACRQSLGPKKPHSLMENVPWLRFAAPRAAEYCAWREIKSQSRRRNVGEA
jgi:hypothetical protein